jgi:long-chain acyl-CoA synthetase
MSHKNILSTITAVSFGLQAPLVPDDVYIAYLPLAHILEMEAEFGIISVGGRIGYATPTTLRDEQARDDSGKGAGDLTVLKPTLMAAVPLVLDRIRAGVLDKIHKRGKIMEKVFNLALYLKERAWLRGEPAPLLDEYIFKPIRQNFGGRLRLILSGGAPLSKETHKFITITVNVPIIQGYGLTESCAGGTVTEMDEQTLGIVGPPIACCMIKLVDIPDMNYLSTDKPYPRGEIWISGDNVTLGYFKMPEKTAEDFREEKDGRRWFATGDGNSLATRLLCTPPHPMIVLTRCCMHCSVVFGVCGFSG